MFHWENGHIEIINTIIRKLKSLLWVLTVMYVTPINPHQPNNYFTASSVPACEPQIRALKKCIFRVISRGSYLDRFTVYPYNRYIRSTNPIVRHVTSLTWTTKCMRAKYHAPKRTAIQPLHDSNTRARAPNFGTSSELRVGPPTRITLPFIRTTDTLQIQIYIYDPRTFVSGRWQCCK